MAYIVFIISLQKKEKKIIHMKFLLKVVTIYFGEKKRFDYKNNHGRSKLAKF